MRYEGALRRKLFVDFDPVPAQALCQIKALIDSDEKFEVNVPDNFHDKMNILYDMMLMVNADGVVEKKEIQFCEEVVKNFGLKKGIVKWLIEEVLSIGTPPPAEEWSELKEYAKQKFVENKK